MRRLRVFAIAAAFLTASTAQPDTAALPAVFQLIGSVTTAARPVANALVIVLNLQNFDALQTYTTSDGSFSLAAIPSGVYKIIAVKQGLVPATATLVPTRTDHRVNLRMQSEKQAKGKSTSQEIWEIRGSLPPDVLREIDQVMMAPVEIQPAAYNVPRLKGEMVSTAAVAQQPQTPAQTQTALGVQSRIGDNWQLGIRGDVQRIDDPTDHEGFGGNTLAEASTMEMELRSSPTAAYRIASTKSSWRYAVGGEVPERQAAIRSHNFEWEHGAARVQVRYFAHDNLFRASQFGSDAIEIGGDTNVIQTARNDVNVSLRVRQESIRSSADIDPLRTANLAANGSVDIAPAFIIHYGVASQLSMDRSEFAPRTGFEWKMTKATSLVTSAAFKVLDDMPDAARMPSLIVWTDEYNTLPRYSYSIGIVSSRNENNRLSATATVTAADSPTRVTFSDGYQQFWDGLLIDTGDVRRDVRVAYRHEFGNSFAVDIATTAGTATPQFSTTTAARKIYVASDVQTVFTPTRTTLAITYREIKQPQNERPDYHSSRVNVRMAQSLYLPIDVKLLLGLEVGRAENSPFLLDTLLPDEMSKRYIGGLALNF